LDKPALRTAMSFLLGGWLIGTILIGFVAAENFWIEDRLLLTSLHPVFHKDVGMLPAGEAREMLRYLVSEQNRFFFVWWGWAEAFLGIVLVVLAARSGSGRLLLGFGLMLAMVAVAQFYLTPRLVELGRALDFVPREPPPPSLRTFGILHGIYSVMDLIKLLIGCWMGWLLSKQSKLPAAMPVKASEKVPPETREHPK
jgi:hypothetical protein